MCVHAFGHLPIFVVFNTHSSAVQKWQPWKSNISTIQCREMFSTLLPWRSLILSSRFFVTAPNPLWSKEAMQMPSQVTCCGRGGFYGKHPPANDIFHEPGGVATRWLRITDVGACNFVSQIIETMHFFKVRRVRNTNTIHFSTMLYLMTRCTLYLWHLWISYYKPSGVARVLLNSVTLKCQCMSDFKTYPFHF